MAIKRDGAKINRLVKMVPEDRRPIAEKIAGELMFMAETLEELKDTVRRCGAVDDFKQGKQEFLRESPALKAYNTTIQRYSLLFKQLTDLLPKQAQDSVDSAIYEFLKEV